MACAKSGLPVHYGTAPKLIREASLYSFSTPSLPGKFQDPGNSFSNLFELSVFCSMAFRIAPWAFPLRLGVTGALSASLALLRA